MRKVGACLLVCYSFPMRRRWATGCMWGVLSWLLITGSGFAAPATKQKDTDKGGLTVEDLARGLRSAGQNIEKEIPKIGPAIGKTVKSLAGNSSDKRPSRNPPTDTK